ncbi:hypothetical protein SK128_003913, partial [Halocaridina rubra]
LSLALGVEVQGEILRGLPCIKRLNQLFCRAAGTSYPSDKIEKFIDDNKALMRRMYGEFLDNIEFFQQASQSQGRVFSRQGRSAESFDDVPNIFTESYHSDDPRGESFFKHIRSRRQTTPPGSANPNNSDRYNSSISLLDISIFTGFYPVQVEDKYLTFN